jgi:hypothetical protein
MPNWENPAGLEAQDKKRTVQRFASAEGARAVVRMEPLTAA